MRESHKQKVKLARKMRTHLELRMNIPIFQTRAWEMRRQKRFNATAKRK